jgi:hypothetical protein
VNDEGCAVSISEVFFFVSGEADIDGLLCCVGLDRVGLHCSIFQITLQFFNLNLDFNLYLDFNLNLQALIWSKKSSGLPITVRTAHSTSLTAPPATVTTVVLDIDIYKNEPRIIRYVCVEY